MQTRKLLVMIVIILFFLSFKNNSTAQSIHWERNYQIGNYSEAYNFVELKDSGFIIVGTSGLSLNNHRALIMRVDKFGDTLWTKKILWVNSIYDILLLDDSSFIVTMTDDPIKLIKYNIDGDSLTSWKYNIGAIGVSNRIEKTPDGGYILRNAASNYGFLKLDSAFNEQWHTYQNMYYGAVRIYPDIGGGFIAVGSAGVIYPYGVQRLDSNGAIIWNKIYGYDPLAVANRYVNDVVILPDSNYLVGCELYPNQFMKINRNTGDTIWTKNYLTTKGPDRVINFLPNTYLVLISGFVYLIDDNADTLWSKSRPIYMRGNEIQKTSDGGFAYCGCQLIGSFDQLAFVKCDNSGNYSYTGLAANELLNPIFYPNPAQTSFNISTTAFSPSEKLIVSLFDMQGRIMQQTNYTPNQPINISTLPPGMYALEIRGKEKVVREKLVKE